MTQNYVTSLRNRFVFVKDLLRSKKMKQIKPGTFPGINNMDGEDITDAIRHALPHSVKGNGSVRRNFAGRSRSCQVWSSELDEFVIEKFGDELS